MKQKITEKYIIGLMKEEWKKKIQLLSESDDKQDNIKMSIDIDGDGSKEDVISPGLKVVKKSLKMNNEKSKNLNYKGDPSVGLAYDVVSIDNRSGTVTLSRPEADGSGKKTFVITKKEFEDNYKRK